MLSGDAMSLYNKYLGSVTGQTGDLERSLTGIARRQADQGISAAGQNFANMGALNSGAAASAFGEAAANPFAQAQSQLQNKQLDLSSNLMNASVGSYGQGLEAASNLMENTSGLVAPQYMTDPKYAAEAGKGNAWAGAGAGALGQGVGGALGGLLGGLF
jgi:hypothetical protein